ncbi:MAG: phenylacetate-CoA oxygenase subunit PaaC [Clostridiales bacterium]|nr:phenylacetate-CoA oxygenase subunit PaaC [Clostridiales bacterium]
MREILLRAADDELALGHRDSEWTAFAPFIEEDIAISSIAQDEIAHAALYLELLKDLTGEDPDRLAFMREPGEWRNAWLLERPKGDWAFTVVRHVAYDLFDDVRLRQMARSSYKPLSEAVERIRREETYHLAHGRLWLERLARGEGEARERLHQALQAVLKDVPGLFEEGRGDGEAVAEGLLPSPPRAWFAEWAEAWAGLLRPLGLEAFVPKSLDLPAEPGGRRGVHTPHLDELLQALSEVYRSDPAASW